MKKLITMLFMLPAIAGADIFSDVMKKTQNVVEQKAAPTQQISKQPEAQPPLKKEASGSIEHNASSGAYVNDQNSCKVWVPASEPGESVTWSGKCVDGYAEGSGAIVWFIHGKPTGDRGELMLRTGKANGKGKLVFADGSSYTGGFVDGLRSGIGASTIPGKQPCRSDWLNDKPVSGCLSPTQIAVQQRQEMLGNNRQQKVESQKLQSPTAEQPVNDPQPTLTKLPLEIKGLTLGMSTEQLLKIYPQTQFTKTAPNTQQWLLADSIGKIENKVTTYKGTFVPFSIMGQEPRACLTAFIENKLVYAEVVLWSGESNDIGVRSTLFKELVNGLSEKFQSQAIIKTETNGRSYVQGGSDRTLEKAIWKTSSQDSLILVDDSFYSEKTQSILTIRLVAGKYESTKTSRLKTAQDASARQEAQQEGARKKDLYVVVAT